MKCISPDVPVMQDRVAKLATMIKPGAPIPWTMTVQANFAKGPALPRGKLFRVSPEEICDAILMQLAKDIDAKSDATTMLNWRNSLLSIPMRFTILKGPDAPYYWNLNERELTRGTAAAVVYCQLQDSSDCSGLVALHNDPVP